MTKLELLEKVNELNTQSTTDAYWACVVMYNWVIWWAPNGDRDKAEYHIVVGKLTE